MPILRARAQIAIKQEANAGTAETLAAADVILTNGESEFETDVITTEREGMTASLDSRGVVQGAQAAKIRFRMHLRGSYNHTTGAAAAVAAGTQADNHVPLLGCGLASTISGGAGSEQNSYKPSSTTISDETTGAYCTVGFYLDGKRYMIHGAVGNVVITANTGAPVLAEFEFTGVYNAPTDTALVGSVVYPDIIEPAFQGAALSVIGPYTAAKISSLKLDLGNTIAMRPDPNDLVGYHTAQIVSRKTTGSFDPEETLAATNNYWLQWIGQTLGAITTGVFPSNGSNNNQFSITIPNAQYSKVGLGARDGLAVNNVEFVAVANTDAGDDAIEIIQT